MNGTPACVLTTVHPPGSATREWEARFSDGNLIVVGDGKTPKDWQCGGADYFSLERQATLRFTLAHCLPKNHYARKNIGYLLAIARGASLIYDTDDDNTPNAAWRLRESTCTADLVEEPGWCNPYAFFTAYWIWPRGFPLTETRGQRKTSTTATIRCPVQQGIADRDPDVDAIFRLLVGGAGMNSRFDRRRSLALGPGVWCPVNSQSSWWWPEAYPLLYLPVTAPFRMTDIWRGFVAQRCLWELGFGVAHHSPAEVEQARNPHDLLADFADEVPGYLHNGRIAQVLGDLTLRDGEDAVCDNLLTCYAALVKLGVLPESEMPAVRAWVDDVQEIRRSA